MIFIIFIILIGLASIYYYLKDRKLKNSILNREFISSEYFEKNWIAVKSGNKGTMGYKYIDQPGCYVILIFNQKVIDNRFSNYNNIYIGQSVNMCKRVHSHFNGKGNGDIYADIKYRKYAYVQLNPCSRDGLNDLEKDLIRVFNATSSYNRTRGGAKVT
jgi:hypothetical protein